LIIKKLSTILSTFPKAQNISQSQSKQGFIQAAKKVSNRLSTPCGLVSFIRINNNARQNRQGIGCIKIRYSKPIAGRLFTVKTKLNAATRILSHIGENNLERAKIVVCTELE